MGALAEGSTRVYPMASRCGVFGKTDVQNLLSREVAHPDIAASILHAVVLQTLATLARGVEPEPMILFSGGPLTFIPALRAAFIAELGFGPEDVLEAPHMELLPATGAALAPGWEPTLIPPCSAHGAVGHPEQFTTRRSASPCAPLRR